MCIHAGPAESQSRLTPLLPGSFLHRLSNMSQLSLEKKIFAGHDVSSHHRGDPVLLDQPSALLPCTWPIVVCPDKWLRFAGFPDEQRLLQVCEAGAPELVHSCTIFASG
jgi:hypothetical protein